MRAAALAFTLLLAGAMLPPAVGARDCRGETPLPVDLKIVPPAADVPTALADFVGAWGGTWTARGQEGECTVLVVEEVYPNGYARGVYSVGIANPPGNSTPDYFRVAGRITDGTLRFSLPVPWPAAFAYRLDVDRLLGTFGADVAEVILTRVPDRAALECGAAYRAPVAPPGVARDRLTAAELLAPPEASGRPVHNDYFLPLGHAGPPRHALRGVLTVPPVTVTPTHLGCDGRPHPLPGFSVAFFTDGGELVPAVRDIVPGARVIFSRGRAWSEPADGGLSRASFPFVTVDDGVNLAHNAIATFVYDDARVSSLAVQVVQETWRWGKRDYADRLPMTYAPGPLADEAAQRAELAAARARELPMRPWSALGTAPTLAAFDGDSRPEDVSASGLVMDGVIYTRGCNSRYGPFPYCSQMRHGVFSVTKSLGAALTLLRLAQKYGDGVFDAELTDYLPAGAHAGWNKVTFAHALAMATAIGDEKPARQPNDVFADEDKPKFVQFLRKRTAREKLDVALSYGRYPWNPGEVLRYNSTQTFTLAWAMDAYLKQREGPGAELWDMMRREVLRPIGILDSPLMRTHETDGRPGLPILGYGMYLTMDDVAKLAGLLQAGGRHDGAQILSASRLADAIYRTNVDAGLPTGAINQFGESRYHLSFWSIPYRTAAGCVVRIPYMLGYGGNAVMLLPNGISTFRFSDGGNLDVDSMVQAGEALRPLCAPATAAPAPPAAPPLTAVQITTDVVGRAYTAGPVWISYTSDGRVYSRSGAGVDVGTWRITADGRFCRTWHVSDGGRERCYVVRPTANGWQLDNPDRFTRVLLKRAPAE
jgi:hypothetical protein